MRKLALGLSVAASAMIVAMLVVSAVTGATQEAHEYTVRPAAYAAELLKDPANTKPRASARRSGPSEKNPGRAPRPAPA